MSRFAIPHAVRVEMSPQGQVWPRRSGGGTRLPLHAFCKAHAAILPARLVSRGGRWLCSRSQLGALTLVRILSRSLAARPGRQIVFDAASEAGFWSAWQELLWAWDRRLTNGSRHCCLRKTMKMVRRLVSVALASVNRPRSSDLTFHRHVPVCYGALLDMARLLSLHARAFLRDLSFTRAGVRSTSTSRLFSTRYSTALCIQGPPGVFALPTGAPHKSIGTGNARSFR